MSVVGVIGMGLSLAGGLVQASAQSRMAREQEQASLRAENSREQQMQLDAQRRRRSAIRESIMARSRAIAVGSAQGVLGSTGVQGAAQNAVGMGGENIQTINQSAVLGSRIFDANRDYARATSRGQSAMAFGAGISSIGGALVQNAGSINRLGSYYGSRGGQPMASFSGAVVN